MATTSHHRVVIVGRGDVWYPEKYGVPALYWNLMLKSRA